MVQKNKYMRIRIPLDPPANNKKIKVQKIKENDDVEEIEPTNPLPGDVLREEDAKFVWTKNSPGCVTFTILGIQFQV
jgi:hypothetical protein